jgi:hypothetical protein
MFGRCRHITHRREVPVHCFGPSQLPRTGRFRRSPDPAECTSPCPLHSLLSSTLRHTCRRRWRTHNIHGCNSRIDSWPCSISLLMTALAPCPRRNAPGRQHVPYLQAGYAKRCFITEMSGSRLWHGARAGLSTWLGQRIDPPGPR